MEHTNGKALEFDYNSEGLRVRKAYTNTSGTTTTTLYTWHGTNLVHVKKGSKGMHIWYDAQNRPSIAKYDGAYYGYIYNAQGDVLGLVDSTGEEIVRIVYDAWGEVLSVTGSMASTLGVLNPFRYRGYIYDTETKWYYLRSRYYSPVWKRFVNADSVIIENLFCYCHNTPLNQKDSLGKYGVTEDNINWDERFNIQASASTKLLDTEFVIYMEKMVREKWGYDYKNDNQGMRKGNVDCVSVYRYIILHYYDYKGYYFYLPIREKKHTDTVSRLVKYGTSGTMKIEDDYSNLYVGMALFTKDENGEYNHVAYYIGNHKAIESNVKTSKYSAGVHIIDLDDYDFVACAYLNGIEYHDIQ